MQIKRAKSAGKQPKPVRFGQKISGAFHDPQQLVGRVTSRVSIRRLHVKDPYNANSDATTATFAPVADQFTNNPNPKFDPSKAPSGVQLKSGQPQPPKGEGAGHAKVIRPAGSGLRLRRR